MPKMWPTKYASLALCLLLAGMLACEPAPEPGTYQGYIEADYTYVAAPLGGRLVELAVQRGDEVKADQFIFALDSDVEADALEEATRLWQQAMDKLADLRKGKRPSEIAAIEAQLRRAQSELRLAQLQYDRRKVLIKQKAIPQSEMDQARAQYNANLAQVAELKAQLETARLGARSDEISAAEMEVAAKEARLNQAKWNYEQKTQRAPAGGFVFDTYYNPGEWVQAWRPVASIVEPGRVKARFFVPEADISAISPGQELIIACDGCQEGIRAQVSYISPEAEYTPPVIYSNQTRAKLVYLIEARPSLADATKLHPGQPVEVRPASGDPGR